MTGVALESLLTCPQCGRAKRETMPADACQFFYECEGCQALLRPKPGDAVCSAHSDRSLVRLCRCGLRVALASDHNPTDSSAPAT